MYEISITFCHWPYGLSIPKQKLSFKTVIVLTLNHWQMIDRSGPICIYVYKTEIIWNLSTFHLRCHIEVIKGKGKGNWVSALAADRKK